MMTLLCSDCAKVKPVSEFYRSSTITRGYTYSCKLCSNERTAKYRAANRAKIREIDKRSRDKNKEAVRRRKQAYSKKNTETLSAKHRAWREANKGKLRIKSIEKTGLSIERYEALLASQGFCCAVCGTDEWPGNGPNVDHDLQAAIRYLEEARVRRGLE